MPLRKLKQYYSNYVKVINTLRISLLDRVKILAYLLVYLALFNKMERSLPNKIRIKLKPYLFIDGVHYKLVDLESLSTLSFMHEPWITRYLKVRDGEIFVDVGAHIGKYALKIAKENPKSIVIAIEPAKDTFYALLEGIKRNRLKNVIALNMAAWDTNTKVKIFVTEAHEGSSAFLHLAKNAGIIREDEVNGSKLDDVIEKLKLSRIDWAKIDVEGAELQVLYGFTMSMLKFKPKIVIEIKEFNRSRVLMLLKNMGYRCQQIPEDPSHQYFICEHYDSTD
jgi:FkbM family methyltransferase